MRGGEEVRGRPEGEGDRYGSRACNVLSSD